MYASDYDVVGIIENNSIFQKRGHSKRDWLEKEIQYYGEVLPNLRKHNPNYPSAEALAKVVRVGNENPDDLQSAPKDMKTQDTPGSDLIIKTLLDNDPRPVHVPCWGGANTVAFALWRLKNTYSKAEFERAASRLRVYGITYNLTNKAQDGGYVWIRDNMPEVKMYTAATWARTYSYDSVDGERNKSNNPKEVQQYLNRAWMTENVKTNHGPLGAYYPQAYMSEGDTPSFLPLFANGLDSHLDYTWGGWGGRAVYAKGNHMVDAPDEKHAAVYRWSITVANDFEARMDWGVASSYEDANHNPIAKVNGRKERTVSPGETVTLDASGTSDPDGDSLTYKWWQYHEADSVQEKVSIANANAKTGASFNAPNEKGKQVHIILEVTDNGSPPLTHYQRVFVNIK